MRPTRVEPRENLSSLKIGDGGFCFINGEEVSK